MAVVSIKTGTRFDDDMSWENSSWIFLILYIVSTFSCILFSSPLFVSPFPFIS